MNHRRRPNVRYSCYRWRRRYVCRERDKGNGVGLSPAHSRYLHRTVIQDPEFANKCAIYYVISAWRANDFFLLFEVILKRCGCRYIYAYISTHNKSCTEKERERPRRGRANTRHYLHVLEEREIESHTHTRCSENSRTNTRFLTYSTSSSQTVSLSGGI